MVGRGESIRDFNWNAYPHTPFMAISSGIKAMPFPPEMWACADAAGYYGDEYVEDPCITKHVPHHGGKAKRADTISTWLGQPNVNYWRMVKCPLPFFRIDPLSRVVADGQTKGFNTMLLAVQVASQLGFRRILMAGVDFINGDVRSDDGQVVRMPYATGLAQTLEWWYRDVARPEGAEWAVISDRSAFARFLPVVQHA
jgi:hypothetical protein